jgi:hypothetical protein
MGKMVHPPESSGPPSSVTPQPILTGGAGFPVWTDNHQRDRLSDATCGDKDNR